nr:PilZ domain-containing protein [Sphingomonas piscis]
MRPTRVIVHSPALLTRADGTEHKVTITDVSAQGFSLEGQEGLEVGEQIYLKVGKEEAIPAEVRWVADSQAGGVLLGDAEYSVI